MSLSTADKLFTERSQLLEKLEIPVSGNLAVLPAPNFISPKLLAFARIFNMTKEQLDDWIARQTVGELLELEHSKAGLQPALEARAWSFLQNRLTLLLRMFPQTLEEDQAMLASAASGVLKVGHYRSLLLQFRTIEKSLLAGAADYAKGRAKIE